MFRKPIPIRDIASSNLSGWTDPKVLEDLILMQWNECFWTRSS